MRRDARSTVERKRDAREKILLGGLVVKAGLREADRAFLMGGLLALASIARDSDQFAAFLKIGRQALSDNSPTDQPEDSNRDKAAIVQPV